jgi:site-specific DNA-methyltransferase (adenine-specific)
MRLLLGDCLDKLKELEDNSVDSIVTDPPYGLSFMGKKWDYDVPSVDIWQECLRVLKPGGHLLSFAGSRTYHRMAVRIEDAGFEIRDQIMWIYGSGFPKSMDISKQIDKSAGKLEERKVIGQREDILKKQAKDLREGKRKIKETFNGESSGNGFVSVSADITEPVTDGAKQWQGWGTSLKPAHEPIVMARKPIVGTVANNVLEWGTGGINIDGCRIGVEPTDDIFAKNPHTTGGFGHGETTIYGDSNGADNYDPSKGRFPANVILDKEAGKVLDEQSGTSKSSGGRTGNKNGIGSAGIYGKYDGQVSNEDPGFGDVGGASRFFYCPKTSKSDRNAGTTNTHPTVKPTDLMGYLIRLVTPKGGVVLDPFMGSGSTGKGAVREGMDFVGVERESEYFEIAEVRIKNEIDNVGKPKKVSKQKETKVEPIVENKFWE